MNFLGCIILVTWVLGTVSPAVEPCILPGVGVG